MTEQRFWKEYWPEVYAICRYILGNKCDANEVAVDVLSDFMTEYVHNLTNTNSIRAYIRIMATRRALRFRDQRQRLVASEVDFFEDKECLTPEEQAQISQLMPRLAGCMETLTPKAQAVLRLRYKKQMTQAHIGNRVGGSKQYISRILSRSLALLKQCLEMGASDAPLQAGGETT